MAIGLKKRGWQNGDPPGSERARGKDRSRRKGSRDGGALTPTEQHQKNQLMRQFMRNPEGGGIGNSEAYRNSSVWCWCGRLKGTHRHSRKETQAHSRRVDVETKEQIEAELAELRRQVLGA